MFYLLKTPVVRRPVCAGGDLTETWPGYLWYLTKVIRGFEDEGLLAPTIFGCAVGKGFWHVINIFTLFVFALIS